MGKNEIDDFLDVTGLLISKIKEIPAGSMSELDGATKEALSQLIDELVKEFVAILSQLKDIEFRCDYCRKTTHQYLGICKKCRQAVCTLCGNVVDEVVLHRGTCTAFFDESRDI